MPTLWDTGSTYLPGRVWGYGTGVNLVVWAGAVPVLFGTPVLPHPFFFVASAPPFFTTRNPQPTRHTHLSHANTRYLWGTALLGKTAAYRQIYALLDSRLHALMQAMTTLRPQRVGMLLRHCRSIKAKRLFLALAERHRHAWLSHVPLDGVDLGRGKRALVPGGRLHPTYQITLPGDLDEHLA